MSRTILADTLGAYRDEGAATWKRFLRRLQRWTTATDRTPNPTERIRRREEARRRRCRPCPGASGVRADAGLGTGGCGDGAGGQAQLDPLQAVLLRWRGRRLDRGVSPFSRWTNDDQYSTNVEYTDYGARFFARVRIVSSFFAEADFQFTSYEYANAFGGTTRASDNSFFAGGGYTITAPTTRRLSSRSVCP